MTTNRYFFKDAQPIAFSPLQIEEGLAEGLQELTEAEKQELLNPVTTEIVPQSVTKAQGKAALIQSGLWQDVIDYVASIEDATQKVLAEVALNDTTHWQRSSPFLNAAAQALGLTDEQLDQMFIDASKIEL